MGSTLHEAVAGGDVIGVRSALHGGANPNELDPSGATPLIIAVGAGSLKLVQALKEGGADPNVRDAQGRTPWQVAKLRGEQKVAQRLEEMGSERTHVLLEGRCELCGESVEALDGRARCSGTVTPATTTKSATEPTGLGKVVDFCIPVILALTVFFGVQGWINADATTIRVRFGAWRLLQISFITYVIYFSAIKPIVKLAFPGIWLR